MLSVLGAYASLCLFKAVFHSDSNITFFSINIAGPDHNEFDSVLFHFNPRQFERGGQLVVNDKQTGVWGQAINLPLSQVPLIFGQTSITLQIQINGDGFDIFIEDKHCARLEHRKELPSKPCSLFLQFPSSDDYGSPENWIVYKTWWGNKAVIAKGDISGVPGVNSFNAIHPVRRAGANPCSFLACLTRLQHDSRENCLSAVCRKSMRKPMSMSEGQNSSAPFANMEGLEEFLVLFQPIQLSLSWKWRTSAWRILL